MFAAVAATFVMFMATNATPPMQESDAISQDCAFDDEWLTLLQLQAKPLSPNRGLGSDCQEELRKMDNDQKMSEIANHCLDSNGYNEAVQKALYNGDREKATAKAAKGFMECANITKTCANEEAAGIVFNVMLAGGAIEDACWQELDKAQSGKHKVEATGLEKCQDSAMYSLVDKLNRDDLDGALDVAAREHFEGCFGMSTRCSVQLAPVLINQIVEQAKQAAAHQVGQQPITEPEPIPSSMTVLLGNLQHVPSEHKPIVSLMDAPEGAVNTIVQHWPEVKAHLSLHKHSD